MSSKLPTYDLLMNPVLHALRALGGSGSNEEILNKVISELDISAEDANVLHNDKTKQTEISYRLGWAKTYLKYYGVISNSTKKGLWSIRPECEGIENVDKDAVVAGVRQKVKELKQQIAEETQVLQVSQQPSQDGYISQPTSSKSESSQSEFINNPQPWRAKLLSILQNMNPFAFERLIQLLLQKCGFINVKVTKKSGDGGIDGEGKLLLQDVVSVDVAFQCKRYKETVGAGVVRDFRGSLQSGVNQGILITTGTFTDAAYKEAANVGKHHKIDLIDREKLIDMIIKNKIGVREVTAYEVDEEFFRRI